MSSGNPVGACALLVAALVLAVGCRAANPRVGPRYDMLSASSSGTVQSLSRGASPVRTMVSTDADLGALQERLRSTLALTINLKDNVAWGFGGATEQFNAPTGAHTTPPASPGAPFTVASISGLVHEVNALAAVGPLSALLGTGGGGLAAPDTSLLDQAELTLDPSSVTVNWVANRFAATCAGHADAVTCSADQGNFCAFASGACATTSPGPTLSIGTRYNGRFAATAPLVPFVGLHGGTVTYMHEITLRPCLGAHCDEVGRVWSANATAVAACAAHSDPGSCADDTTHGCSFAASTSTCTSTLSYRQRLAGSLGADAVLADNGLAFDHRVIFGDTDIGDTINADCAAQLLGEGPLVAQAAADYFTGLSPHDSLEQQIAVELQFFADTGFPPLAGQACNDLHQLFDDRIKGALRGFAPALETVGGLLINPPSFRANLEQVLIAAGFDTNGICRPSGTCPAGDTCTPGGFCSSRQFCDSTVNPCPGGQHCMLAPVHGTGTSPHRVGNGVIEVSEANVGLMAVAGGALDPTTAASLAGAIACRDGTACTGAMPMRSIAVALVASGGVAGVDTVPGPINEAVLTPAAAVGGAFTDRTVQSIALGTTPGTGNVSFTGASIDLRVLRAICERAAPRDRLTFGLICAGGCAAPMGPPTALCDSDRRILDFVNFGTASAPIRSQDLSGATSVPSFALPTPAPGVAHILETAPLFAQELRTFFANALNRGFQFRPPSPFYPSSAGTARVLSAAPGTPGSATLTYILDPDEDGVDSEIDNCPATWNPAQSDADIDHIGDACDGCPGLTGGYQPPVGSSDEFAHDVNHDHIPDQCDCDIDGDHCQNPSAVATGLAAPCLTYHPDRECDRLDSHQVRCANPPGTVDDRAPLVAGTLNFDGPDGDRLLDDCDADNDDDGVPDATDNCPFGNSGSLVDPGPPHGNFVACVDSNPDQTDTGGTPAGDICDTLCSGNYVTTCTACQRPFSASVCGLCGFPGGTNCSGPPPRAAGCTLSDLASNARRPDFGNFADLLGFIPTPDLCLFCDPTPFLACGARSLTDCLGGPAGFAELDGIGEPIVRYGAQLPEPSTVSVSLPDLNGDGIADRLVGVPSAPSLACNGKTFNDVTFTDMASGSYTATPLAAAAAAPSECQPDNTGVAHLVSGLDGSVLDQIALGQAPGSLFGTAAAFGSGLLAIGAPGEANPSGVATGAVHLFDVRSGSVVYVGTQYGEANGDQFGAMLQPIETQNGVLQVLVGAPRASGANGAQVGVAYRIDIERGVVARYAGSVPRGGMTSLLVVRNAVDAYGAHGPADARREREELDRALTVVIGSGAAESGRGALFFFDGQGRRTATVRGAPGDRLGAAVAAMPQRHMTSLIVFASAPGYQRGVGAIRRYRASGEQIDLLVGWGTGLGETLGVATLSGRRALVAGFERGGVASTLAFYEADLIGRDHGHGDDHDHGDGDEHGHDGDHGSGRDCR